ncbi:MAG: hypothetical protein WC905_01285 [Patescibacteria group bacterium]|jgi:hypothetical protein
MTDIYSLHEIDYSAQGWDAILAADMAILDAVIPTRILGTLGETVAAYTPLYLKASDSKWYKAKADGSLGPCHGLAVEGGDADDEIRIHRMGKITNSSWTWSLLNKPVYLDPSTAGTLTQTRPSDYIQIVGFAISATEILVIPPKDIPKPEVRGTTGGIKRLAAEATGTPSGTTTYFDITVNVPSGARLLGTQLRVDTALTTGETWSAAYQTGSSTVIAAAGQAVAKNTKINKMHVDEITTDTTVIRITRDAGNFTDSVGVIRAICYYETFETMEDSIFGS